VGQQQRWQDPGLAETVDQPGDLRAGIAEARPARSIASLPPRSPRLVVPRSSRDWMKSRSCALAPSLTIAARSIAISGSDSSAGPSHAAR